MLTGVERDINQRMSTSFVKSFAFNSGKPGPSILALGAVHGDGTAGTIAIQEMMAELENSKTVLLAGKFVAVPIANPAAYALKKRLVVSNMNRLFTHRPWPENDEERAANEILPLIDACDAVIDFHSCHRLPKPFAFVDYDSPENRKLAIALGFDEICTGWTEMYIAEGLAAPTPMTYAHSRGKTATVAECGLHDEPMAVSAARDSLRRALSHFGMLPPREPLKSLPRNFVFERRIVKQAPGKFTHDWQHTEPCRMGEVIARYDDGREIVAEKDGCILFPTPETPLMDAWFHYGRDGGLFRP